MNNAAGSDRARNGLRAIACFEALKGTLVLLLGFGILSLIHQDLHAFAEQLIERLHIDPERPFARAFLDLVRNVADKHVWLVAFGGVAYALVRFIEAWGLWFNRVWAQYFGILSGALYLPWEAYAWVRSPTLLHGGLFAANLTIVVYLVAIRYRQISADRLASSGHLPD